MAYQRGGLGPDNETGGGMLAADRNRAMEQKEACLRWLGTGHWNRTRHVCEIGSGSCQIRDGMEVREKHKGRRKV